MMGKVRKARRQRWRIITCSVLISIGMHPPVSAGVNEALSDFFDQLGYGTHVTSPSAYQGQQADYYTGGSLFVRTPVYDTQISQITMPRVAAGCGGIDLFMGGFSHVSSKQLIALGKTIVADAIPFGVDLALQTWAPQIKSIRDNLQSIADRYLTQSINSCESAQAAISGLWPFQNAQSQKHICATMGMQNNAFADWAAAQQGCGAGGEADTYIDAAQNDPVLGAMVKRHRNLVWQAIHQQAFLAGDTELAEFFQSMTGTVVYDDAGHITRYPSLLTHNNNLIHALLDGGQADRWQCDKKGADQCLQLTRSTVSIKTHQALTSRVADVLGTIITHYQNDLPLTNAQISFLEYTSLPVLKLMATSLEAGHAPRIAGYAHVIAMDLIARYLDSVLDTVRITLAGSGHDPYDLERLYADIGNASQWLQRMDLRGLAMIEAEQAMMEQSISIEQRIEGAFSSRARQNLGFEG